MKLPRADLRCCRSPLEALRLENALDDPRDVPMVFCSRCQGPGIMREELDLNKENSEKRKSLPHALKCQGRYWKAAVQFEEDPGRPDLNAGRHKSRWRNYHGSLHLHGDETHTPEWRKKNRRGKLRQVFYSWATIIVKYACPLVNYIDKYPYRRISSSLSASVQGGTKSPRPSVRRRPDRPGDIALGCRRARE